MGDAPDAPNPYDTAKSQLNFNVGSGIASGIVNNPNVSGPSGSTSYTKAGEEEVTMPDGTKIKVPRYNQTTTLGKAEQEQKNKRDAIMGSLLGTNVTSKLPDYQTGYKTAKIDSNFSTGQPTIGFMGVKNPAAPKLDDTIGSKFNSGQLVQNPNTLAFTDDAGSAAENRRRFEENYASRGSELLKTNRDSEVARLAAMGLAPGGENYGRVSDQFEKSANDLAIQAQLAGGQEFQNLTSAENARRSGDASFKNEAITTGYGMDKSEAEFGNTTKANQFALKQAEETMRTSQIEMENARRAGDSARYNAAKQAHNAAQQQITDNNRNSATFGNSTRQSMINELLGIISGAQVQSPGVPNYQGQSVESPDYTGMVNSNYQQQVGSYNNNMSGIASIFKTLLGAMPIPGAA